MHVRPIVVLVFAFPLYGCGELGWFSGPMDPKTKPTSQFWASLQGIHKKHFPGIRNMMDDFKAATEESDWDRAAELLHELSNKHQTIADQLRRLSHENVDVQARAFRDQLVAIHQSIAKSNQHFAMAVKEGDPEVVRTAQFEFRKLYDEHAHLWESGIEVVENLTAKYGKDFSVQQ